MNFFHTGTATKKQRLSFLALAAILAICFNLFFWHQELGLNFFLFTVLYIVGYTGLLVYTKHLRQPWTIFLALAALIMSVTPVLYQNEMVHTGVPLFVVVLLFVYSVTAPLIPHQTELFHFRHVPMMTSVSHLFSEIGTVYRDIVLRDGSSRQLTRRILSGVLISLPVLLIFGGFFYAADSVFANMISGFNIYLSGDVLWLFARTGILFFLLSGLFYGFLVKEYHAKNAEMIGRKEEYVTISVVLFLVNLLFLVFVVIQFAYLFGGREYVLANHLTYAEYARKGFFQLLDVMVLVGLMITGLYRWFHHAKGRVLLPVLEILLIIQTGIIGASALTRLNLYQEAYGFTVLRLYSDWFIYFMLVVFGWFALSILLNRSYREYVYVSLAMGVTALVIVTCQNVDYTIAKKNVDRFLIENKELDIGYILTELSIDVAPAVEPLYTLSDEQYGRMGKYSVDKTKSLLADFHTQVKKSFTLHDSFLEYNVSVQRAYRLLETSNL